MQTSELVSAWEATEKFVKILHINYAKSDLYQVANNATQLNAEDRN